MAKIQSSQRRHARAQREATGAVSSSLMIGVPVTVEDLTKMTIGPASPAGAPFSSSFASLHAWKSDDPSAIKQLASQFSSYLAESHESFDNFCEISRQLSTSKRFFEQTRLTRLNSGLDRLTRGMMYKHRNLGFKEASKFVSRLTFCLQNDSEMRDEIEYIQARFYNLKNWKWNPLIRVIVQERFLQALIKSLMESVYLIESKRLSRLFAAHLAQRKKMNIERCTTPVHLPELISHLFEGRTTHELFEALLILWLHLARAVQIFAHYSIYPGTIRPPCTTMPWTIWPALVVLWGVCWMFHINGGAPSKEHRMQPAVASPVFDDLLLGI